MNVADMGIPCLQKYVSTCNYAASASDHIVFKRNSLNLADKFEILLELLSDLCNPQTCSRKRLSEIRKTNKCIFWNHIRIHVSENTVDTTNDKL